MWQRKRPHSGLWGRSPTNPLQPRPTPPTAGCSPPVPPETSKLLRGDSAKPQTASVFVFPLTLVGRSLSTSTLVARVYAKAPSQRAQTRLARCGRRVADPTRPACTARTATEGIRRGRRPPSDQCTRCARPAPPCHAINGDGASAGHSDDCAGWRVAGISFGEGHASPRATGCCFAFGRGHLMKRLNRRASPLGGPSGVFKT